MKNYSDVLKKCRLFDDIGDDNLIAMLGCLRAKVRAYGKNQAIMSEGEKASDIGIMLKGRAQLIRDDYYGNRSIVANIQPSQLFAESFVCAGADTVPVDIIATEDSEVMLIDGYHILHTCSNSCSFHNQMIFNLMRIVANKNLIFDQKIEITSKRTTREKLLTYLMHQSKANGSNSFVIPYDRQELADYLEVDRSGLSAEISKLRREGVLQCRKNEFTLLV